MTEETGSSQSAGGAGRGRRRPPRRGGRGFRGRGRRRPSERTAQAEATPAGSDVDEPRPEEQSLDRDQAPIDETQNVSTQDDVREEITGADVQPHEAPARPSPIQQRPPRHERQHHEPRRFQQHQPRQRHPDQEAARQPGSAIHEAIQDVEQIITDLRETLEEMEEVLETLEQAEREKTADEREIEQLRRTLKGLHRGRDNGPRPGQHGQATHRGEGRERRTFRGPESQGARPQRAGEEHRSSEASPGEIEHHEEHAPQSAEPETPDRDEGYDEPQPS